MTPTLSEPNTAASAFDQARRISVAVRDLQARAPSERLTRIVARLEGTVLRPLRSLMDDPSPDPEVSAPASAEEVETALSDLAIVLTRACATNGVAALLEACAGTHGLVATSPSTSRGEWCEALSTEARRIPVDPTGSIRVRRDGPYLLLGAADLTDHLGVPVDRPPVAALCRCGRSATLPWCDGTHAETNWSSVKHADRLPDHLDDYKARQFHILDNRGLCAHSGRCTDALPTAFRVDQEPFVAPAGARADDILRAVQACPSGALGVAIADLRAAELVDGHGEPSVLISRDGPYYMTGGVALVDEDGAPVERLKGASFEHYALCRCGQSKNKPFCSGAHWYAGFHDPVPDPEHEPTLFEWAGGYPPLLRTTRLFYERHVPQDEELAPLFACMESDHPERVAAWLSEVFGGPPLYSMRYGGYARMISQHLGRCLTEVQRSRWVALLARSAEEARLPADPEFRAAFVAYLEWGSRIAVENSQLDSHPPEGMPVPRWWWVCDAAPSARPPSRLAAARDLPPPPAVETPEATELTSFARHIKGLFRPRDRGSMRFAFDLWSHDDVRTHASSILDRLRDGSMPCDGAWPRDRIAIFERWIAEGCAD